MKQQYKDLMIKFLENNPGLEVTSNPIGWWRHQQTVGETILDRRSFIDHSIAYGELESAITALYVRDKIRSAYTSYKVVYDGDKKEFIGKVKRRDDNHKSVSIEEEVPEEIWFNTANIAIDIDSKSNVDCNIIFNVRNGMFPPNVGAVKQQMEFSICRQIREQLQGRGRVSKRTVRETVNYSKVLRVNFLCSVITHNNEDVTIKL